MKRANNFPELEIKVLLADDDIDDCGFFKEALQQLPFRTELTIVNNGEKLIELLTKKKEIFDVLFLDMNMPCKDGFACLKELKDDSELNKLLVIILSTSSDAKVIDLLYRNGAHYYICKPPDFTELIELIGQALAGMGHKKGEHVLTTQPPREKFVLNHLHLSKKG